MTRLHKNKYIDSLMKTMLFSAIVHNTILITLFLRNGDINTLNYFKILDLDTLFPTLHTALGTIFGFFVMMGIYAFFLIKRK